MEKKYLASAITIVMVAGMLHCHKIEAVKEEHVPDTPYHAPNYSLNPIVQVSTASSSTGWGNF